MADLFETTRINGMTLANRFVRSATWEGLAADDGASTPKLAGLMATLAKGGVGLIISGHAYVRPEGQAGPWQLGACKDELIPELTVMTNTVHVAGGRIVLQLAHAGFFADPRLTGRTPLAPSALAETAKSPRREMTPDDIAAVVEAFGCAAGRAKQAGFDGVQIHAAHGYLLSQFLSPAFNRRTDRYGGTLDNRARALVEVLGAVRRTVGPDYPVLVKMNCGDFIENGLSLDDAVRVAEHLADNGIDAIEISGGVVTGGKLSPSRMGIHSAEKEAYFLDRARAFRKAVEVPLILVGGNRSYAVAETIIREETVDYIAMSRPLIRQPDLINRWQSGDREKAECLSDNQCFAPARAGEGIFCVTRQKSQSKG